MNNIQGITSYSANNNAPIMPFMTATRPNGFYAANISSSPVNSQIQTADYFTSQSRPASSNIQSTMITVFDDLMAKVAPKMYLNKYISKNVIENAVQNNPNIAQILSSKGLTPTVYMENVRGKNENHFMTTYLKAKELGKDLPLDEYSYLMQASLLHDIGKVFIPPEILNKPGKLTSEEKEIVDLHAQLGYEILKTTPLNPKVLDAVRLHHMPVSDFQKQNSKISQIVSVADVYSALKEERPYKAKLPEDEVRRIMQSDEKLNQEIVNDIFYAQDISNINGFVNAPAYAMAG